MYKKILAPIDGSARAEKILPHVEEIALRYQASVTLLLVIDPAADISTAGLIAPLPDQLASVRKEAETYLNGVEARLKEKKIETQALVGTGIPLEVICQTAEQENVDLIVIGSRGLGGITGFILGSTSRRIVDSCTKPVLVVK